MFKNKNEQDNKYQVNERIRAKVVRVVGDNVDNAGVMTLHEALKLADEMELDLVLISEKADPPVCRIIDFQKFLY